jgi:peroxiredoxin Q/BCP
MLAAVAVTPVVGQNQAGPKVGDKLPDFKLTASDGKEYSLSQFKGKMGIVMAWYPKAATRG